MQIAQFAVIFAIVACAAAVPGHYGGEGHHVDYFAYPKYNFDYGVHDGHTGDVKSQWEARDGGVVKGSYSLKEGDRSIHRSYVADSHPIPVYHHHGHSGLAHGSFGHY